MRELFVAHSKDLVCSEGTFIHYALQSLLYLCAWLLLVIALGLQIKAKC